MRFERLDTNVRPQSVTAEVQIFEPTFHQSWDKKLSFSSPPACAGVVEDIQMNPLGRNLQRLENVIIAVCFIVMCLAEFGQVANRNVFHAGISWFDELARYCMVYMTLLATEAGLRDGSQIAITSVTEKCPPFLKRVLQLIVKAVIIAFSVMITMTSYELVLKQLATGQVSAGFSLPMWIPYLVLPVAFGFITVVQTIIFFKLLTAPLNAKDQQEHA